MVERNSDDAQVGRPNVAVASAADLASYGALVSAEIARHKNSTAARAAGEGGAVTIFFTIGANGRVTAHAVTATSGNGILDAAADAMMEAVQAPPPPGRTFQGQVTIRFQTR
jgi:protein TonB